MAKKPNRRVAEAAIVAVKDLLLSEEIQPDSKKRQLSSFVRNPTILAKHDQITENLLLECYWEHCLREIIRDFLQLLTSLSKDDLEYYRRMACNSAQVLLVWWQSSGCLQQACSMLVNKFGDISKKIQCNTINLLA